jgi:hypothetical protein
VSSNLTASARICRKPRNFNELRGFFSGSPLHSTECGAFGRIPSECKESSRHQHTSAPSLNHRRSLDFDLEPIVQMRHRNDSARRPRLSRPTRVDLVKARPVIDIDDIDTDLQQLGNAAAYRFERGLHIRQYLFGLYLERSLGKLVALRVDWQLSRDEHKPFATATWL